MIGKEAHRLRAAATIAALGAALLATLALAAWPGAAPGAQARGCADADKPASEATAAQLRRAAVCLINKRRARHHRGRLTKSKNLTKAAESHTEAMVEHDCFAHRCGDEPDLETRIRRTGYLRHARGWGFAENTGCAISAEAMVKGWAGSVFHRRNLLDRDFRDIGVGVSLAAPRSRCERDFATFTAVFAWRMRKH